MHSGTEWWLKHSRTDFSRRGLHIYMHEAFVRDFSQPVGCAFLALSRMCFFNTLDKKGRLCIVVDAPTTNIHLSNLCATIQMRTPAVCLDLLLF